MRKSNVIDMRSRSPYVYKSDSYRLRDCLSCCTQEDLEDIASYQGMDLPKGMKREALINLLEPQIVGDFKRLLPFFLPEDIELLDMAVAGRPQNADILVERDLFIYDLGYLFFFFEGEQMHPVLPLELREILAEELQKGLLEQLPFRQEFADYAETLLHLYGIYEATQLQTIWNENHREQLTWDQVWEQLTGMEDVLAFYWCDEGLVVSDYFQDYTDVDSFLALVGDIPYYKPGRHEMRLGPEGCFRQMNSASVYRLENCLKEMKENDPDSPWDYQRVLQDILDGALFYIDCPMLFSELEKEDLFVIGEEDKKRLGEYYLDYRKRTPSWALRGHKPGQLPEEHIRHLEEWQQEKPKLRSIMGGKK